MYVIQNNNVHIVLVILFLTIILRKIMINCYIPIKKKKKK